MFTNFFEKRMIDDVVSVTSDPIFSKKDIVLHWRYFNKNFSKKVKVPNRGKNVLCKLVLANLKNLDNFILPQQLLMFRVYL